jgi:NADPH-dependent curcumin reductase CurA
VFVSAAAGAVGSIAGQIARIKGCRVVGSAGSREKVDFLVNELGFDAAINYREGNLDQALAAHCPNGIDVYFDNVGGDHLQAALGLMNAFGRISACGMISQYNNAQPVPGPNNLTNIVRNRLLVQGFIISDHLDRRAAFLADMSAWIREGEIKHRETVVEGLENAPRAFLGLLQGENTGKMLVKLSD